MSLKIHWQEGLFLQPHHLQRMQKSIDDAFGSERHLGWPYPFGVIEYRLNRPALANKRVMFDRLRVMMPSGVEVNYPSGAELPALDIAQAFSRGSGSFTVYLGVPVWQQSRANTVPVTHDADTRAKLLYRVGETECYDENTGENPKPIQVRKINSRLMLEHENRDEMEVIPLLRVVRATGQDSGLPKEDPEFVPPCMVLHGSIVLQEMVRNIVNEIEATRKEIANQIFKGALKWDTMSRGPEYEQVFRLRTLNRYAARLRPLFDAPMVSPFEMYLALREALVDLAALQLGVDLFVSEQYHHENQYLTFVDLTNKIRNLLTVVPTGNYEMLPFKDVGGVLTANFKEEHFTKPNAYFLGIFSEKIDGSNLSAFVQDGNKFKFMPLSLAKRAVFGIELKEERVAPMGLPARVGLHYFRLERANSQRMWDAIKNEKAAAVVWLGSALDWSDAKFELYMTIP